MADVYCIYKCRPFWIELKANDSNNLQLSGYQLNWHSIINKHGGHAFILVKTLEERGLKIYSVVARGVRLLHQTHDTARGLVEELDFMHAYTLKDIDK